MKEETHLDVVVERLLFVERERPDRGYTWRRTYLCRLLGGRAAAGYEPEIEATDYVISEVRWFDLRDKDRWPVDLLQDAITYPQVLQVRRALGYLF
jgi:ADP-ribose pyrophosphatase YjhB (NUDIX family)